MKNVEGSGPLAYERAARLTEPRGSERLRFLVRLGQEAGRVLEDLGHRLPDSVAAWQFLPSALDSPPQEDGPLSDVVRSLRSAEAVVDLVEVRERWATGPLRKRAERIVADAEQITLKKLQDSVQAPPLALLWLELLRRRAGWSWPVPDPSDVDSPLAFLSYPVGTETAAGGCEDDSSCHLDVDGERWPGMGTAFISLSELAQYMSVSE